MSLDNAAGAMSALVLVLAFSSLGVEYLEHWRFLLSMWREQEKGAGRGNRAAQLGRLGQLRGMGLVQSLHCFISVCKCLKNVFILMLALRRWTLQISAKLSIAIGAGGSVAWAVQWVVGEAEPDLTTGMILKSFILFGKIWFTGSLVLYLNPYSIRHRESVRATQEKY